MKNKSRLTTQNNAGIFIEISWLICWYLIPGFLPAMHSRPLQELNLIFLPPCEGWHLYTVSPPQLWNVGTGFLMYSLLVLEDGMNSSVHI